jgi:peptidoglycan/LPS O-acetylase OafA/YrhL
MTYPLYLVHNVAGVACSRMLIVFGLNPIVALVGAAIGMITLSYVICRFWEPAARAYLQRGLDKLEASVQGRSKQLEFLFASGGVCEQTRGAP